MKSLLVSRLKRDKEELLLHKRTINLNSIKSESAVTWFITLNGPENTAYENGLFELKVDFVEKYPFKPPTVIFKTKIFHPNIDDKGNICLDILKTNWTPTFTMKNILTSIISLMSNPNPDDPLRPEAANLYKESKQKYNDKVKEYTRKYAK